MDTNTFSRIESYMLSCMKDGAHDEQHIYRVLYLALEIAAGYDVDIDILIASALLHDIGRDAQYKDPNMDHAVAGAEMAYEFIMGLEWDEKDALHIRNCIRTHRYRTNQAPESMEAKILFDSDKLDATGTMGIARTIAYKGIVSEPLYSVDRNGNVRDGTDDKEPSFFHEYNFKLKKVYDGFYTDRAREIARSRKAIAEQFYEAMFSEVSETYELGRKRLRNVINNRSASRP